METQGSGNVVSLSEPYEVERLFWKVHMYYNNKKTWYVLRIRPKYDQLVERALNSKQFSLLNPTYQEWSQRKDRKKLLTKPVFSGYMFIHTLLNPEIHLEILKTYGVTDLMKNSRGPIPVPDHEIENVCLLETHIGECFHSPEFAKGDFVRVCEGPLTGLVGQIDWAKKKLLRLSVSSVPGSIAIEVNPMYVELIERDPLYATASGR